MREFQSSFAPYFVNYVKLRRKLGFQFNEQANTLLNFDKYLHEQNYHGPITQKLALEFATANPKITRDQSSGKYSVIRYFTDYLSVFMQNAPKLEPMLLPRQNKRAAAYIYSNEELVRLLHEAWYISKKNPIRGITLHAMVGLAACTGLRIGEVVKLDNIDVDLNTGILNIRQTKFQKDRLVPVHPTIVELLKKYLVYRDEFFVIRNTDAFFINLSNVTL